MGLVFAKPMHVLELEESAGIVWPFVTILAAHLSAVHMVSLW